MLNSLLPPREHLAETPSLFNPAQTAITQAQRELDARRRTRGSEDPDTVRSFANLAALHAAGRDYERALPLLQQAADGARRAWGPSHPSTLELVGRLGVLHVRMAVRLPPKPLHGTAPYPPPRALGAGLPVGRAATGGSCAGPEGNRLGRSGLGCLRAAARGDTAVRGGPGV